MKLIDVILAIIATSVFAAAVVYLMFLFSLVMIIVTDERERIACEREPRSGPSGSPACDGHRGAEPESAAPIHPYRSSRCSRCSPYRKMTRWKTKLQST